MRIEVPDKLACNLFNPHRYKITHGGRGSAKSRGYARALLIQGIESPHRILCAREFQNSITESVHALLAQQIDMLGLGYFYTIKDTEIVGQNGTQFIFAGLRHNITKIKSMEGIDVAWVEEAQSVSKASWDVLIPTIRKPGSEIWITFNPELETDETYKRFVLQPPTGALVLDMNWRDNPWFPDVLKQEMDDLKARDEDAYLHVWEGKCRQTLDGAIYARELREASQAGRITKVPHSPAKPVDVFFDLGWSDNTSLWFKQQVGLEHRVIRAYQNRQVPIGHYLQYMQSLGYVFGTIWLPHDARAKQLGTGLSVEEMVRNAGFTVRIVPQLSVEDGINALRTLFPMMYWDEIECADGIQAMRRYRYDVDSVTGQYSKTPKHDDASHFADAARYMAVAASEGKKAKPMVKAVEVSNHRSKGATSWMK